MPEVDMGSVRIPAPSDRAMLPGEADPDEGLGPAPLHNCTIASFPDLLLELASLAPNAGAHHKVRMVMSEGSEIGFMLWIPAHFEAKTRTQGAWPTVFSLHGRGETVSEGSYDRLQAVVRHGLQHRMDERAPFNRNFVLITPQMQSWRFSLSMDELQRGVSAPYWLEHVPNLERLRIAVFGSELLDRSRAYLTGVSVGGTGVWAWAAFNSNHVQPWAAIVASSSEWPYEMHVNETRPFEEVEAAALMRLSAIPGIYVIHCANDGSMPIYVGALTRPRCIMDWFGEFDAEHMGRYGPPRCSPGADAIVEALEYVHAPVKYERLDFCPMVHQPSDSHYTSMYESSTTDLGHDSAQRLYASPLFVEWLLAHRLPDSQR